MIPTQPPGNNRTRPAESLPDPTAPSPPPVETRRTPEAVDTHQAFEGWTTRLTSGRGTGLRADINGRISAPDWLSHRALDALRHSATAGLPPFVDSDVQRAESLWAQPTFEGGNAGSASGQGAAVGVDINGRSLMRDPLNNGFYAYHPVLSDHQEHLLDLSEWAALTAPRPDETYSLGDRLPQPVEPHMQGTHHVESAWSAMLAPTTLPASRPNEMRFAMGPAPSTTHDWLPALALTFMATNIAARQLRSGSLRMRVPGDAMDADEARMRASYPRAIAALAEIIKEVAARVPPSAKDDVSAESRALTSQMITDRDEAITYALPAMLLARQMGSLHASGGSACDIEMFDAQELGAVHAALVKHLPANGAEAAADIDALSAKVCRSIEEKVCSSTEHHTEAVPNDVKELTNEVFRIVHEMPPKRIYITLKLAYEKAGLLG